MAKEWIHHGPPKMLLVLYGFGPSIHLAQRAAGISKDSDVCCVWRRSHSSMAIRMSSKMGTYMHNTTCYDMPIVSSGLVHVDSVQLSCAALWKISSSMLLAGIIGLLATVVSFFLLAFSFLSSSAVPFGRFRRTSLPRLPEFVGWRNRTSGHVMQLLMLESGMKNNETTNDG